MYIPATEFFYILSGFGTLMLEDNMSDHNTLPYVLFRLKILPHTTGNVQKQRDKLFALPVHLLRQVFYGFHRFWVDLYGFHGFLGPGLERSVAACGGIWPLSLDPISRLVRSGA